MIKKIFQDPEIKKRILILLLIVLSINGLLFITKFVGYVITPPAFQQNATAGTITEIDFEYREPAYNWAGVYGVALPADGYTNLQSGIFTPADMEEKNLIFSCFPEGAKFVFATMINPDDIVWSTVIAATPSDVDEFIGFNGSEISSGGNTYRSTLNVAIGQNTIITPAVNTYVYNMPDSTAYGVGILKDSLGNLIFAANVGDFGEGFIPGNTHNYQFILPINYTKYISYLTEHNLTLVTLKDDEVIYYFTANPLKIECPKGRGIEGEKAFIEGFVKDGATSAAIQDAFVTIGQYWTVTDAAGFYHLDAPSGNGTLELNITSGKEDYETFVGSVIVFAKNTTSYDITLNKKNVQIGPGQTDYTNTNVGPGTSSMTDTGPGVGPGIGPGIGPYLEEPKKVEGQDFIVSIPSINRRIKLENFVEESIDIYSFKDEAVNLEFSAEGGVSDFIEFERNSMVIPGRSNGKLNFRIFGRGAVGVYNGTIKISGSVNEQIPVRIEITDKDILTVQTLFLDIESIDKSVNPGDNYRFKTTLRNLLTDTEYPVHLFYTITDSTGKNVIYVSSDYVNLKTTFSLLKTAVIPKIAKPGEYVVTVQASYLDLSSTVSAPFTVTLPFYQYMLFGKVPLWWIFIAILVLLIIGGAGYWYYRNLQSKKKYHLKVDYEELPKPGPRNVYVGKIAETDHKAYFNLENFKVHTIVAGTTGGGKSFCAQGIIEEMLLHNVAVIVFDPTAQWTGFLRKLQSKGLLALYPIFGMKPGDARAFNGNIRMIRDARELIDIKKFMRPGEIQIFACHKLDPKDMDIYVSNAIKEVFHGNFNESPELRLMLVFDEIHRILPKFGGSGSGFLQIERGCREFRKWGVGIMLISQVLGDFMGEIKANINTEIQLRTRDEGDLERISTRYGKEVLQSLVKATVGTGMIENPAYNRGKPYFISFKPIMHSVERLGDEDIEKYNKYNEMIDQIEFELKQFEEEHGQDVFDMKLELKLSLDKVKSGNFNMVDIYLEGLKPRIDKLWQKLGKTPKKYQMKLVSDAELAAELLKAKAEKAKAEAEEKKKAKEAGVVEGGAAEAKPKEKTSLDLRTGFQDAFTFANGQQVTNLQELMDVLPSIGVNEFAKSVSKDKDGNIKNDLAVWMKNKLGAVEFAEKIKTISDKDETVGALDHEIKKPSIVKNVPVQAAAPQVSAPQVAPIISREAPKIVEQSSQSQQTQTPKSKTWAEIKKEYDSIPVQDAKIAYLVEQEKNLSNEPNIKYALAIEYHKKKDYKNAESKYLDTLKLLPNNPKVLSYLKAVQDAMKAQVATPLIAEKQVLPQNYFKLSDGTEIKSYVDLKEAIKKMDENIIKQYVNSEKNDFASWVENALSDKSLADKLRTAHNKSELEAILL